MITQLPAAPGRNGSAGQQLIPAENTGAGIPGKLHPYEVQVWKFRKRQQPQTEEKH